MDNLLSGFVGALIGGLIGFGGVVWQFRAQALASERDLAAALLATSDAIRDAYYRRSTKQEQLRDPERFAPLAQLESEMIMTLRRWEVGGSRKNYPFADRHGQSTSNYLAGFRQEVEYGSLPGTGEDFKKESEWFKTRGELVAVLSRATGHGRWQFLKRRQRRMEYLRPQRKLEKEIARGMKKL